MVERSEGYQEEGWRRVASLVDVPDGGCLAVDLDGRPLVLVRHGERVRALDNCCPHAGAPLSEGFVEEDRIVCAWHGWSFDVETGCSTDVAGVAVPTCRVRVEDGEILVRA